MIMFNYNHKIASFFNSGIKMLILPLEFLFSILYDLSEHYIPIYSLQRKVEHFFDPNIDSNV